MRWMRLAMTTGLAVVLMVSVFGMTPASAQSVGAWLTVATNHPAVGCSVDTNVQLKQDGSPVVGAEVSIILSEDGSATIIDSMTTTTTETGYAWLSFDTTNAAVAKTWLEVRVNGVYMGGRTIWVDGSSCSGAESVVDMSGDAPVSSSTAGSGSIAPAASSNGVFLPLVTYHQARGLSCEYAAVQIATEMIGAPISEYDMEAVTPLSDNPHWGYRGNIDGEWGNTTDYGIYADALVSGVNHFGYGATSFYGGADDLTWYIDNGNPVIVWMGMRGDDSHYEYTADGTRYQLTAYQHVMVVYGYDDSGVYLADPGNGGTRYYDWGTFISMWQILDGMALALGT